MGQSFHVLILFDIERLIGSGVDCSFDLINHNFTYKQMEAQIFTALTFNIPCVARCRHYDQIQRSLMRM